MSLARTLVASLCIIAALGLPPAFAAQTTGPRTKPESLIAEAIRLLQAKDYVKFLQTFIPPDSLKKDAERGHTLKRLAQEMIDDEEGTLALIAVFQSLKDISPTMSADGKTATYRLKDWPVDVPCPPDVLILKKTGKFWYFSEIE